MELQLKTGKQIDECRDAYIGWNREEITSQILQIVDLYKGRLYDDSTISQAKDERAKLNNLIKRFDDTRKSISKTFTAPITKFKEEVDQVIAIVEEAVSNIDKQIKEYENTCKVEKRKQIERIYSEILSDEENHIDIEVPLDMIFDERWYNKTFTLEMVEDALNKRVFTIKCDLETIKAIYANDDDIYTKTVVYYAKTLDMNLSMKEAVKDTQLIKSIAATKVKAMPQTMPRESKEEEVHIQFEVVASSEKLMALKEFMINNGIKYTKIAR